MHVIVDIHGSHEKMDAGMPEVPVSCIFRFLRLQADTAKCFSDGAIHSRMAETSADG